MDGRFIATAAAGLAYIAVSQWLMTSAPASDWNAVVIVGPMLIAAAMLAWQRAWRVVAAVFIAATVALVLSAWRGYGLAPAPVYVVQHAAIHLLLASVFALTLQRGRVPLIARLAEQVHASLTLPMRAYCRQATLAWVIYFLAMAALSVLLYATTPFVVWATFANLGTPLAVIAMFGGEYVVRYRLHPEFERATLGSAVHAWRARQAAKTYVDARAATAPALADD